MHPITRLNAFYVAYFGRPADATGLTLFASQEDAAIIQAFDASAESVALYGTQVRTKIQNIYRNLFDREAEAEGLAHWEGMIATGQITAAGAAIEILRNAQGMDRVIVERKLQAADYFVHSMDTDQEAQAYAGMPAAAIARDWLEDIDDERDDFYEALGEVGETLHDIVRLSVGNAAPWPAAPSVDYAAERAALDQSLQTGAMDADTHAYLARVLTSEAIAMWENRLDDSPMTDAQFHEVLLLNVGPHVDLL